MTGHTKEPWPYFIDWCEPSSPHPDSEGIVRLGFEDYRRARACVNACRGLPTDELEQKGIVAAVGTELLERDALVAQMLEALEMVIVDKAPGYHDCTDNGEPECAWCVARAAITAARGTS